MQFFSTENLTSLIRGKHLLLDNDFLGLIFKRTELFKETLGVFNRNSLIIDPLTEFEFLRDVFVPEERILREQFLNFEIFTSAVKHQEVFSKIQENALLLSKLYAHHNSKTKASTVDLLLAGRIMFYQASTLLLTGNKKDFSSCIFNTLGALCIELDELSGMRTYTVIEFSKDKFTDTLKAYEEMEKKGIEKIRQDLI